MKRVLRVLVLSIDAAFGELLTTLVRNSGHRPVLRSHCTFQEIREEAPDLLLLDLHDEERGLDLLKRLVRHRLTGRTPVIVLSERHEFEYELIDAYDFLFRTDDPRRRLKEGLQLLASQPAAEEDYPPLRGEAAVSFQHFLAEHAGLHFDQRNMRVLERGLLRRMRAVQSQDYPDYFDYLDRYFENRGELKKLLSLLTVGETYFFRYRSDREALVQYVLPELIRRRRAERRLLIWSAGCSTGEEPYSIAILLLEHFPQLADWQIEILATDINKRSLQKARLGIYGSHALRLTAGPYRERYFTPIEGDLYRLDPRVRGMVHFAYHNLQTGDFPNCTAGKCSDLIFCRNVLIYFRRETFVKIVEHFHRCLPPHGYLFLGHSENLAGMGELFQAIHQHGAFFYQPRKEENHPKPEKPKVLPVRSPPLAPPSDASVSSPPPPPKTGAPPNLSLLLEKARQTQNREDFAEAGRCYGEILRQSPDHLEAIIGLGLIQANLGHYAAARQFCDRAIGLNDLYSEAYLLRGQTFDMEGRLEEAAAEYQKVLWLQMDLLAARYSLARIHSRQGRLAEGIRDLRTVLRQLEKLPAETVIPHSGGLTREVFLEICREDLAKLSIAT
jgi:chemotaxis protein methyltransferase CheR